ncbi:hypothetical protein EJ08DRAFT_196318 [Tothia fuscella]|uniref:Thioredoxin domain-containing protein n=1 Tax=Tothia fuscella TaxID=1048955 RepID=A0A9P4TZV3_9PEZI|nr:hypothetical protein EJ08DRAFT_196318 [Tothia fuscella]
MTEKPIVPASIQARIAALKLEQVGRNPDTAPPSYDQAVGAKRKPPPPPPRPGHGARAASVNVPPLASNGVASSRTVGNLPAERDVLPAPVLAKWEGRGKEEKITPSLPPRRVSTDPMSPPLPPRRPSGPSDQSLSRRPSNESISSIASGRSSVSGISTRTSFSVGSGNQHPKNRIRVPEYDPASLPPLPERKAKVQEEKESARLPLRPTISTPNGLLLLDRKTSRDPPPSLPSRPALPSRAGTNIEPPPPPRRSALDYGMNKSTSNPPPVPRTRPNIPNNNTGSTGSALVELDANNFDEIIIRSGKPALVDFYAPFCKYCREIDPVYAELAEKFRDSGIIIAKVDSYTHKAIENRYNIQAWPTFKWFDGSGDNPIDYDSGWEIDWFSDYITQKTGIRPGTRAVQPSSKQAAPPPVPLSSRPNIAELQTSKPKAAAAGMQPGVCLKCRDFSAPDKHAARFPRQSIPSTDIAWLAHQLCDPFPSATDKARAIFTWLHHNIDYDTEAFFSGNLKASTPNSTIATGLAVCEGYSALFTAMAAPAGLESVVASGHGKGFGHSALAPGSPIPPYDGNHAWNAVKIDNREWKLIDCCWGAGNIKGPGMPYNREFSPEHFTMSNDDFGLQHYPENNRYFFRDDGRPSITWEEYMLNDVGGEKCIVFSGAKETHGLDDKSFLPKFMDVKIHDPTSGPTVRFQFNKICQHYDNVSKHGQPYLFFFKWKRPNGQEDVRCFQTDGYYWWLDVPRQDLGKSGDELNVQYVMHFNTSKTDGRGMTESEFMRGMKMGKPGGWNGCQWNYLARWTVR